MPAHAEEEEAVLEWGVAVGVVDSRHGSEAIANPAVEDPGMPPVECIATKRGWVIQYELVCDLSTFLEVYKSF